MKFEDFVKRVDEYHYDKEPIYFTAIAGLERVRENVTKLDDNRHLAGIVKPFLIKWGRMGRVVGRKGLNWKSMGERLRGLEKHFNVLREESFQTIDFGGEEISDSILTIYDRLDPLDYLGSPTTIAKTLHLLNPEIFVMWDDGIRQRWKKKNWRIIPNSTGYLVFLQEMQKEVREVLIGRQKASGEEPFSIEKKLRDKYENKTLAKLVDQYNYVVAHPC